jgi:hypothetical protein
VMPVWLMAFTSNEPVLTDPLPRNISITCKDNFSYFRIVVKYLNLKTVVKLLQSLMTICRVMLKC